VANDPKLVARLETLLAGRPDVTPRKMFGGVCFMLNGNMCVGVHNDELIVRVGKPQTSSLLECAHVRPMDLTGKPMKGWLTIGRAGVARQADLERYVRAALSFVNGLPPK
jgi:hypothetical protein